LVQTLTPISLYGRQPGLTYRSICPSIPGFGAGDTPPKTMPPWIGFVGLPTEPQHPRHPQNPRNNFSNPGGILLLQWYAGLSPYTPSPSNKFHSWRGIWGEVKKYIFCFVVGEVPFPSNTIMLVLWIGVAFIPPFFCRLASPHNHRVVWFIYNYFHLLLLRRWICNFWWYILFCFL